MPLPGDSKTDGRKILPSVFSIVVFLSFPLVGDVGCADRGGGLLKSSAEADFSGKGGARQWANIFLQRKSEQRASVVKPQLFMFWKRHSFLCRFFIFLKQCLWQNSNQIIANINLLRPFSANHLRCVDIHTIYQIIQDCRRQLLQIQIFMHL